ncbi:MAG TPA: Mrp/NBP35 family ATP-binding protein [Acidimicrobiales bacterium]|nr:Mrp/NBP35 family ATP-binding protein [Acidimicrobiales bacterium]
MADAPNVEQVREALTRVIDPELGDNIVDLGMVRNVAVSARGEATVTVALTVAGCPLRSQIDRDVRDRVAALPGITAVDVEMGEMTRPERAALMDRARRQARERAPLTDIPASARVVAIASGKGGVGKSSVTVNLATAIAGRGFTVGVLDADIWGFSVPRMLGLEGRIPARDRKMVPLERHVGAGLLKVVSMGFLSNEDEAIMWRGLILNRALQHFLEDVAWGALDYLLIDMPPGTGDIQMGLARMLPRAEMVIVTTPALAAQKVAARAADMARRGHLRVAGVIENMSAFVCDHGTSYPLFGVGGGERLASEVGTTLLGSIPLDPEVVAGGDPGSPVVLSGSSESPVVAAFEAVAERMVTDVMPVVELAGCTARMLENVEAAVAAGSSPRAGK